jgi:hypothetical protein
MFQKIPEMQSLHGHQKYKTFLEKDRYVPLALSLYFREKLLTCWNDRTETKPPKEPEIQI